MGRALVLFMPCACCLLFQTCVFTGCLLTPEEKAEGQRICLLGRDMFLALGLSLG
jgi:hypothetical protein